MKQAYAFSKMYDKRQNYDEGKLLFIKKWKIKYIHLNLFIFNLNKDIVIGPIHINTVKETQSRHKGCVQVDFLL